MNSILFARCAIMASAVTIGCILAITRDPFVMVVGSSALVIVCTIGFWLSAELEKMRDAE